MCGIVVYYGDAENRISRLLNGMWAIVYRAPDSTGIGLIGSDLETLKIRRELGSFEPLIDRLIDSPVFDETELRIVSVLDDKYQDYTSFIRENQKKLLRYEGFAGQDGDCPGEQQVVYPRWSKLYDTAKILEIEPGTVGNPEIQEYFAIDSAATLKRIIQKLLVDFDLPLGVVEKLICRGFQSQLEIAGLHWPKTITRPHLLEELKAIIYRYAQDRPFQKAKAAQSMGWRDPGVRKYVWKLLKDVNVILPSDFTTDGVANLFRSIDSSVLALSAPNPDIDDSIQKIFENLWSKNKTSPSVRWRSLYRTEKLYNVYGIAAAAALTYFQREIYLKQMPANQDTRRFPPGHIPGRTHPLLLKYMVQPVIGQGRWAVQSAISVKNSHPFLDEKKFRAVVLNGMFSSGIESRLAEYLTEVAGITLRSENSTELFSLLWGHYFETFFNASYRYRVIEAQIRLGLEGLAVGSLSIDYGFFNSISGKSAQDLDEMAFIKACEVILQDGGQFAVAGISLVAPDRLFVATHKRPIYIVTPPDSSDFMVVSDINAAIGLFPQSLVQPTSRKLQRLLEEYSKKSLIVEKDYFDDQSDSREAWFKREKMALLEPFRVEIHALTQERVFARIKTRAGADTVLRQLEIFDFSGKVRQDIQPEQTYLSPLTYQKEFGRTFYEEHLREIPTLLKDTLARYTGEQSNSLRFEIKPRLLQRRFGAGLSSLNRIIFVGTGTSLLLSEIVEKNMERFFSGVNIVEARTHEFDNVDIDLNPDGDLVVLASWSGATAEIVDFASRLLKRQILVVGITEKPFSDLGLIVRKSAGIVPVCSGEEVTLAATKSAVCMLFTMYLFCLYLSGLQKQDNKESVEVIKAMRQLPEKIRQMLEDTNVVRFCRDVAAENQGGALHYLLGSLLDTGTERVAALNLEINAWNSMGVALDFSELKKDRRFGALEGDLVIVNATSKKRLKESIQLMSALDSLGIRFYCVTYNNREKKEIGQFAAQTVLLPKVTDYLQPFIDLPFMFLFGFYFGLARGRLANELPRNLAKSVTAGRSGKAKESGMSDWCGMLERRSKHSLTSAGQAGTQSEPVWIHEALFEREKKYYRELIGLCARFYADDPFAEFFKKALPGGTAKMAHLLYDHLAEDGVLIFVPMDKEAEGGVRNFMRLWSRFFSVPMQVEFPEKLQGVSTEGSILMAVATRPPAVEYLDLLEQFTPQNVIWVGPENNSDSRPALMAADSRYILKEKTQACGHEEAYLGLSLLFSRVMRHHSPKLAGLLAEHFKLFLPAVTGLLSDGGVKNVLACAMKENVLYRKRLFITSLRGSCSFVRQLFHLQEGRQLEGETFGMSSYSHLVLVDPAVNKKYVALEGREQMVQRYSENQVDFWERRYLRGNKVDGFQKGKAGMPVSDTVEPFLYEDTWYLPVLRPDYNVNEDCLVIIDATSETHFDAALDELAVFGSRYARLIVLTQQQFAADSRLAILKKHPLSEIVYIPGLQSEEGHMVALSDYVLPVILNVITTSMYYSG